MWSPVMWAHPMWAGEFWHPVTVGGGPPSADNAWVIWIQGG
jgi:hypothetical protein